MKNLAYDLRKLENHLVSGGAANGEGQPYGTYDERLRAVTNETITYLKGEVDYSQG